MQLEVVARFEPLPDISAYELAYVIAKIHFPGGVNWSFVNFTQEQWDNFDPLIKRHFFERK